MKLGFSYKFLFYLLLIVIIAYIALKYFNVIENMSEEEKKILNQIKNNPCIGAAFPSPGC